MSKRWFVERRKDEFEDVGYNTLEVHSSGALIFRNGSLNLPEYIIASGQWISVVNNDES